MSYTRANNEIDTKTNVCTLHPDGSWRHSPVGVPTLSPVSSLCLAWAPSLDPRKNTSRITRHWQWHLWKIVMHLRFVIYKYIYVYKYKYICLYTLGIVSHNQQNVYSMQIICVHMVFHSQTCVCSAKSESTIISIIFAVLKVRSAHKHHKAHDGYNYNWNWSRFSVEWTALYLSDCAA